MDTLKINNQIRRIGYSLWPTVLFGVLFRSLVPGELLLADGYWFLPAAILVHLAVHYLYAKRRNIVGPRVGTGKVFSDLAFLAFMVLQVETVQGESHPVLVWFLHMVAGFELGNIGLAISDAVWNKLNLFLAGMLAFSYFMLMVQALHEPVPKPLRAMASRRFRHVAAEDRE